MLVLDLVPDQPEGDPASFRLGSKEKQLAKQHKKMKFR